MRRSILLFSVAAAWLTLAQPTHAQLKYGVEGVVMTGLQDLSTQTPAVPSLNNTFGLGARVALQPPLLPIGAVAQGVYYFPEGDWSYMTYSLAAQLRLPLPVLSPYAIGGWQWRRTSLADVAGTESGAMVGLGVQLNLGVALFVEGSVEFNDEIAPGVSPDNSIVIKGGVLLGR